MRGFCPGRHGNVGRVWRRATGGAGGKVANEATPAVGGEIEGGGVEEPPVLAEVDVAGGDVAAGEDTERGMVGGAPLAIADDGFGAVDLDAPGAIDLRVEQVRSVGGNAEESGERQRVAGVAVLADADVEASGQTGADGFSVGEFGEGNPVVGFVGLLGGQIDMRLLGFGLKLEFQLAK